MGPRLAGGDAPTVATTTSKLDWVLAGGLVIVVAGLVCSSYPGPPAADAAQSARRLATSAVNGISIAVLPLANLSGDQAQEFFSDGMTDEITLGAREGAEPTRRRSLVGFPVQGPEQRPSRDR